MSTYNEPLITAEWAVEIFREARAAGLMTAFVSNGNGTPRVLDYIRPVDRLYKVDLKSFDDRHYRQLGGRLQPILVTIRALHEHGHLARDRDAADSGLQRLDDELKRADRFLASVSPDIPWHVTAFHKDYRMSDPENTTPEMLIARGRDREGRGAPVRLRRKHSRPASATSRTRAATTAANC